MSHSLNTVVVHKYTLNKKKQPIGHNTGGGNFPNYSDKRSTFAKF